MACNTTASLDKFTCTEHVEVGKCQDKLDQISWSKDDSYALVEKLKLFKKDEMRDRCMQVKHSIMGGTNFYQFLGLRNQLVLAAEIFGNFVPYPDYNLLEIDGWTMNNSCLFTNCSTSLIVLTERFVWLYCDTMWTIHGVAFLKSDYLQERRKRKIWNNLSIRIINLKNFFICLTLWIFSTMKLLLIHEFVMSCKKIATV